MIPAMHIATEKYATTNNTLAIKGTLAMSGALRAPCSSPSMPIIALDARGSNVPSRRLAIHFGVGKAVPISLSVPPLSAQLTDKVQ